MYVHILHQVYQYTAVGLGTYVAPSAVIETPINYT
jgi:hypothetical protein